MCNLSNAIERKGIAEGMAEGRAEGVFGTTLKYYKRGRITAVETATDLNIPVSEFMEKIKGSGQQPTPQITRM